MSVACVHTLKWRQQRGLNLQASNPYLYKRQHIIVSKTTYLASRQRQSTGKLKTHFPSSRPSQRWHVCTAWMVNAPAPSPLSASAFHRMHTTLLVIKANTSLKPPVQNLATEIKGLLHRATPTTLNDRQQYMAECSHYRACSPITW